MKEEHVRAIKCMVFAQAFVECMDEFEGSSIFKQQIKNRGRAFVKEVDKFLDSSYTTSDTEHGLINLIEECQRSIESVIDNDVELVE
jgi:hypothetical protein